MLETEDLILSNCTRPLSSPRGEERLVEETLLFCKIYRTKKTVIFSCHPSLTGRANMYSALSGFLLSYLVEIYDH